MCKQINSAQLCPSSCGQFFAKMCFNATALLGSLNNFPSALNGHSSRAHQARAEIRHHGQPETTTAAAARERPPEAGTEHSDNWSVGKEEVCR